MSITDWSSLHGNHFEGERVCVTGGAGFIGSHLTEALIQLGATVTVGVAAPVMDHQLT